MNYWTVVLVLTIWIYLSEQHGRVMEPPARNCMWRAGFNTPPNYEDTELFCGGLKVQWEINGGKCGICGDAFNRERRHETGGVYASNITTRTYQPGGIIDVIIELIANHGGAFEFHLCPRNSFEEIETENCFETLKTVDGLDKYELNTPRRGIFTIPLKLPENKTCSNCILRWHWKSANNWGVCENKTEATGCGPQETYRNCADIAIDHEMGIRGPLGSNAVEDTRKHWRFKTHFGIRNKTLKSSQG